MGLRKAYLAMIKGFSGGMELMASGLGMSACSLTNRIYEKNGQSVSVADSLAMQALSGTTHFAEAIAELSGGTFVKLPECEDGNEELSKKFHELYIELGQLSASYTAATADGEIDKREKAEITEIRNKMLRTTQTLTALMFRVHCKDQA